MASWLGRLGWRNHRNEVKKRLAEQPLLRTLQERCTQVDPKAVLTMPLGRARFVVLDTETTGLRVYAGDEIISIAMLELDGLEPTGRELNTYINPRCSIPADSTEIHGITDADVQDAPDMDNIMPDICEFIGDAVIVGHHINFDLRFLNRNLNRLLGCKFRNPSLDTMLLYLGHSGRLGHYSLEDVADYCHVEITGRHTAWGDAAVTARVFRNLAEKLAKLDQPVSRLVRQQVDADDLEANELRF